MRSIAGAVIAAGGGGDSLHQRAAHRVCEGIDADRRHRVTLGGDSEPGGRASRTAILPATGCVSVGKMMGQTLSR